MRTPQHIKYRGKVYVKAAAPGAFTSYVQRLNKLQSQMVTAIDEMKGLIHYRVRGQGSTKGIGLPTGVAGEEHALTVVQRRIAERVEEELQKLQGEIKQLLPTAQEDKIKALDEFMAFTA